MTLRPEIEVLDTTPDNANPALIQYLRSALLRQDKKIKINRPLGIICPILYGWVAWMGYKLHKATPCSEKKTGTKILLGSNWWLLEQVQGSCGGSFVWTLKNFYISNRGSMEIVLYHLVTDVFQNKENLKLTRKSRKFRVVKM